MHHSTILSSILFIFTFLHTQIIAQKCLLYNSVSLPVTYRDICVSGVCVDGTTFMPDFDIPTPNGYGNGPRIISGYVQDYCAAITLPTPTDLSLRPQGCNSPRCTDTACNFNSIVGTSRGLVQPSLGEDGLPVWRNNKGDTNAKKSIASATSFNKWYHDSQATIRIESQLNLIRKGNTQTFEYKQPFFFPLDGEGWFWDQQKFKGDDGNFHNFGFTTAIKSEFIYMGGEHFTFRGDDDVWVFIDNKLAIDIGGIHSPECRTILLDEAASGGVGRVYTCIDVDSPGNPGAARAGETYTIPNLIIGSTHTLSIFHAERHDSGSSFAISTSIAFITGDTAAGGLDYNLPSATGARIYIGTYQFIALGQVDSAPEAITLPIYTGTPYNTPITITLEFPPVAPTQIACRILQLSQPAVASLKMAEADRNTIAPPLDVAAVKATANQATWASVTVEADHSQTNCATDSTDQPSWTIVVRTTGVGSGVLYCIAVDVSGLTYSDYTASGRARDTTNFYRKWVATTISSPAAPTTLPPTTLAPTTIATTLPPTTPAPTTQAPTTQAPTTAAPTTLPPTTLAPTTITPTTLPPTTQSPSTPAPTTLPPTTIAPTTVAPTTIAPTTQPPTTLPPTTPAPTTKASTTAEPTTQAPPTTLAPTILPPTTDAPSTPPPRPTTTAPTTQSPTTAAPTTEAPVIVITTPPPITVAPPTDTPTLTPHTPTTLVLTPTTETPTTATPTNAATTAPPTTTESPTTQPPTPTVTSTPNTATTPAPTTDAPTNPVITTAPPTSTPTSINPTDAPTSTPTPTPGSTFPSTFAWLIPTSRTWSLPLLTSISFVFHNPPHLIPLYVRIQDHITLLTNGTIASSIQVIAYVNLVGQYNSILVEIIDQDGALVAADHVYTQVITRTTFSPIRIPKDETTLNVMHMTDGDDIAVTNQASPSSSSNTNTSTGAIGGGVIAAVIVLLIFTNIVTAYVITKRHQKNVQTAVTETCNCNWQVNRAIGTQGANGV